jgi:VanZ family protein
VLFAFLNLLAGSAVAALTEYVQGLLPYRTKDFSDFKADFLALVISTLLVFLVDITSMKKRSR